MSLDTARMVQMANAIRALSMDAVQAANSGHPGMPMGMADVATVLWSEYLKHDPKAPDAVKVAERLTTPRDPLWKKERLCRSRSSAQPTTSPTRVSDPYGGP